MPFYFRKSVNVGPFGFNISGSGIGVSAGVRGFRVGTGPRGHYIHAGRGGFYYRSSLGGHSFGPSRPAQVDVPALPAVGRHVPVETGNISDMVDTDAASVLNSINENLARSGYWPLPAILSVIFSLGFLTGNPILALSGLLAAGIFIGVAYWLYRHDETRLTTILMYDLEDEAIKVFEKFVMEFDELSKSQKVMNIDTKGVVYDWKRHGGAAFEVKSGAARFAYGTPKRLRTNVSVPFIEGGLNTLYFFPDLLLIRQNRSIGGLDYRNVRVQFHDQRFHEAEHVPGDAMVVGHTWRFVRRDGGPDRRFNNNRQIPIVNYQAMVVDGPGNFQKVLYLSKNIDRIRFVAAVRALGRLHGERMPTSPDPILLLPRIAAQRS